MNSRLKITILAKKCLHVLFALMLAFIIPVRTAAQDYYPVHATVQVLPPYSLYLSDYSNGFRDRLVVTLYNRDLQQQTLDCRLRLRISNTSGFCIESRDEVPQRSITVEPNVPLRLTSQDIAPYLQPGSVKQTGTLRNGRLPEGMMTFSVQVVEQHTGRILSPWASGRAWLETKKPPMLVMPEKDETVAFADPQHILFRWYPQHLGLSGVEYELHIREMLDNCQNPAAQYDSGVEVFTTKTRQTQYNYSNIDPELIPGHTYAWRVRAVAMDGIDEVGVFDNDGYSETGWFRLVRGCDAPVIDRAEAGYRKLDLGWHGSADDMRYTVQYSAEKENGSYNWTDTTTIDNETTLYGLTPGATYSYRVGALCSATGKPVYSQIGTVQIPNRDSISAANCGVAPVYKELSKERKTDLKVGDRVTVGGDYTMLITELNSKGNGVYGGKGRLTFTWVFFVGLEVTFDDLVVNTDGYQIDGTVNTVYDGTNTNIANLDQLNDGGVNNRESRMSADGRSTLMNFSVPPMPRSDLSEDGGSVVVYDLSGAPHTIEIPSNGNGGQSIPFSLTDIDGNTWRFESCDSVVTDSLTGSQKTVHGIKMTKLDAVSGFSKDKLSDKVKARIAFANGGFYAFDDLRGKYYDRSSKLGKDYLDKSSLGDGTFAPWKLVPMGKSDKIKAGLNPTKIDIDIASVRFVDADGHDLESSYDSDNAVWTVSLTAAATEGNYYNVYAVAKPKDGKGSYQTIGKLFVVSYKTTKADIVLLPVEKHDGDISKLNAEISDIFAPCGVEINITESDALVGNTGWDLNGDGKLSLTNDAETDNVKRSAEMKALEDIVKSMPGYDKNVLYLVYVPKGSKSSGADVEGNWGRGRQIGYVFENLDARTVAHEVGHAFTLQHTFDRQYGGNETRGKTENLMDYTDGTNLDAFQWEILAHNAPKIVASVVDGAEDNWFAGSIVVTPNFEFTTIPETSTISSQKYISEFKVGTLSGFKKNKKFYEWHDGKFVDINNEDSIYTYTVINPSEIDLANRTFLLFYNTEFGCGKSAYIDVPLDYKKELVGIIEDYNINKYKVETEKKLIGLVKKLMAAGKPIPCVREGVTVDSTSSKNGIPLYCEANEIKVLLNKAIEALNKITANTEPSVTRSIIEQNYSACLFENLSISTRMSILKSLFQEGVDDENWIIGKHDGFGGQFYLGELVLSTPKKDRLTILKEGFMADNYRWIQVLLDEGSGAVFNNDVRLDDMINLFGTLGIWVKEHYGELNIPVTKEKISQIGIAGLDEYEDNIAFLNPICIGDCGVLGMGFNKDAKFYNFSDVDPNTNIASNYIVLTRKNAEATLESGRAKFLQSFYNLDSLTQTGGKHHSFREDKCLDVDPFETVILLSNRKFLNLGIENTCETNSVYEIPAFVAVFYCKIIADERTGKNLRHAGNCIAIGAALLSTPVTGGASLALLAGGGISLCDEIIQSVGENKLNRDEEFQKEYGHLFQAWDNIYTMSLMYDVGRFGISSLKLLEKHVNLYRRICCLKNFMIESKTCTNSFIKNTRDLLQGTRDGNAVVKSVETAAETAKDGRAVVKSVETATEAAKDGKAVVKSVETAAETAKDGSAVVKSVETAAETAKDGSAVVKSVETAAEAAKDGNAVVKSVETATEAAKDGNAVAKSVETSAEAAKDGNAVVKSVETATEAAKDGTTAARQYSPKALDEILERKCGFTNFTEKFRNAYKETIGRYYKEKKLMQKEEEALACFYNFLEKYYSPIKSEGLQKFLTEMFARNENGKILYDKFKVAVTTIESLKELDKFEGITSIVFEERILKTQLNRCDIAIHIEKGVCFIETKNYQQVSGIFSNIKQLEAYIKKIKSFKELLFVIQKRDKVQNVENVFLQLKKAIANDAEAVFDANEDLWQTFGVKNAEELRNALDNNSLLNDALSKMIKLTD